MQINISLPQDSKFSGTEQTKQFLKQLELAVHHAQKSLKHMIETEMEAKEMVEMPEVNVVFRVYGWEPMEDDKSYQGTCSRIELELYTD